MPRRAGVIIEDHAKIQYRARGGPGRLTTKKILGGLRNILPVGVETRGDLVVPVPISRNLVALCTPSIMGGWLCITVLTKEMYVWQKSRYSVDPSQKRIMVR